MGAKKIGFYKLAVEHSDMNVVAMGVYIGGRLEKKNEKVVNFIQFILRFIMFLHELAAC